MWFQSFVPNRENFERKVSDFVIEKKNAKTKIKFKLEQSGRKEKKNYIIKNLKKSFCKKKLNLFTRKFIINK